MARLNHAAYRRGFEAGHRQASLLAPAAHGHRRYQEAAARERIIDALMPIISSPHKNGDSRRCGEKYRIGARRGHRLMLINSHHHRSRAWPERIDEPHEIRQQ